jgi:hypothetical protein
VHDPDLVDGAQDARGLALGVVVLRDRRPVPASRLISTTPALPSATTTRSNRRWGSPIPMVLFGLPVARSTRSMRANEAASVSSTASTPASGARSKGSSMKPFSALMKKRDGRRRRRAPAGARARPAATAAWTAAAWAPVAPVRAAGQQQDQRQDPDRDML